jgi:hypothetical protein
MGTLVLANQAVLNRRAVFLWELFYRFMRLWAFEQIYWFPGLDEANF